MPMELLARKHLLRWGLMICNQPKLHFLFKRKK
jgi:hypothetical protein